MGIHYAKFVYSPIVLNILWAIVYYRAPTTFTGSAGYIEQWYKPRSIFTGLIATYALGWNQFILVSNTCIGSRLSSHLNNYHRRFVGHEPPSHIFGQERLLFLALFIPYNIMSVIIFMFQASCIPIYFAGLVELSSVCMAWAAQSLISTELPCGTIGLARIPQPNLGSLWAFIQTSSVYACLWFA